MSRRNGLSAAELAEAAVLADLAALVVVIARLTPLAGLTSVLGAVPFAVLALRHRLSVVWIAFWVTAILVFLMAGFGAATQVLVMALFGSIVGRSIGGGWSRTRTVAYGVAIGWTTVASLTLGFLTVFANLRQLNLDLVQVQWDGMARLIRAAGLDGAADQGDSTVEWAITNWWLAVPIFQLVISMLIVLFILRIARPVVKRVRSSLTPTPTPPARSQALAAEVQANRGLTVITGANGSGKSTLLRAITDQRGDVGARGGTAVIGQRPDSQVIGARVIDDLNWGLDPALSADEAAQALERVGLADQGDRESGALSGGELQRLALAAALLRSPTMVLSDESTAMIDPEGRAEIMALLRRLADDGVAVVHVTHLDGEVAAADHLVEL
jgi:energy-coupling factor transport system ATP-binding protein